MILRLTSGALVASIISFLSMVSCLSPAPGASVSPAQPETGIEPGMVAPEFTMPDSEGVPFSLRSQRGKVALVDISAIW